MKLLKRGKDILLEPLVHHRTLIWLHGLGDSAEGFLPVFKDYFSIENCRIVLLTAPVRPVTINGGMQMNSWFDIISPVERLMNPQVAESAEIVLNEINNQRKDTSNIIIGGFSQGGALSLYTGLSHADRPVNGIIGFSSYAMEYNIKSILKNTPVFLYHGQNDFIVPFGMAKESYEKRLQGVSYTLQSEANLGHQLSLNSLNEVKKWVNSL
jgi:phospholipase/carboxylesterase